MANRQPAQTRKSHKSQKNSVFVKTAPKDGGSSPAALATRQPHPTTPSSTGSKGEETPPTDSKVIGADDGKGGVMLDTGIPQEAEPKKQNWYRPPDSKARKWVEKIVVHREAGRGDAEIAKVLKISEASVRQYVWLAKKNGWLDDSGELHDLEAELALNIDRKIVRNISASLDGRMTNYQTHEMTIAAAKGRGVFKSQDAKVDAPQMTVVAIRIEMPPLSAQQQVVNETNIGGVAAYVEGEVEEEQARLPAASEN